MAPATHVLRYCVNCARIKNIRIARALSNPLTSDQPKCYSSSIAEEFKRASGQQQKPLQKTAFKCPENNPLHHQWKHEGLFYTLPDEDMGRLFQRGIGTEYSKKVKSFQEMSIMVRKPALEIMEVLKAANFNHPPLKFLLYGENGTGKTMTLLHLIHHCAYAGWTILHVPWPAFWVMHSKDLILSSRDSNRRDQPAEAVEWLAHFKSQNLKTLKELKCLGSYVWSKREVSEMGSPLLDIVDHGLNRGKHASDCIGVILKEMKKQATDKKCRVLLAVDGVNGFWRKSNVKDEDRQIISSENLSIVHHFKKLIRDDWSNGAVIASLDVKAFLPEEREQHTPVYLLGKDGFELFDPFIPIQTENYSEKEAYSCLEYFIDRHWIQHPEGRTEEGMKELIFKSGGNPYLLDRATAPL